MFLLHELVGRRAAGTAADAQPTRQMRHVAARAAALAIYRIHLVTPRTRFAFHAHTATSAPPMRAGAVSASARSRSSMAGAIASRWLRRASSSSATAIGGVGA